MLANEAISETLSSARSIMDGKRAAGGQIEPLTTGKPG
jgi:hypothetical protein